MKLEPNLKIQKWVIFEGKTKKSIRSKTEPMDTPPSAPLAGLRSTGRHASKQEPLNIILLGDPAAGKATHGQALVKKFHLYNLDMGQQLRKLEHNPKLRKKYKLDQTLDSGKLTPTQLVRQLLHDNILTTPQTQGILFNGTPKMMGEAKLVARWLKQEKRTNVLFIYLSIPLEETIRRMTGRKEYFKGKFSKRPDDSNKALKNRLGYYKKNISEVVAFFQKQYPYVKISTIGTVPEARKRIFNRLSPWLNKASSKPRKK